jgi:hypothetical protein
MSIYNKIISLVLALSFISTGAVYPFESHNLALRNTLGIALDRAKQAYYIQRQNGETLSISGIDAIANEIVTILNRVKKPVTVTINRTGIVSYQTESGLPVVIKWKKISIQGRTYLRRVAAISKDIVLNPDFTEEQITNTLLGAVKKAIDIPHHTAKAKVVKTTGNRPVEPNHEFKSSVYQLMLLLADRYRKDDLVPFSTLRSNMVSRIDIRRRNKMGPEAITAAIVEVIAYAIALGILKPQNLLNGGHKYTVKIGLTREQIQGLPLDIKRELENPLLNKGKIGKLKKTIELASGSYNVAGLLTASKEDIISLIVKQLASSGDVRVACDLISKNRISLEELGAKISTQNLKDIEIGDAIAIREKINGGKKTWWLGVVSFISQSPSRSIDLIYNISDLDNKVRQKKKSFNIDASFSIILIAKKVDLTSAQRFRVNPADIRRSF